MNLHYDVHLIGFFHVKLKHLNVTLTYMRTPEDRSEIEVKANTKTIIGKQMNPCCDTDIEKEFKQSYS